MGRPGLNEAGWIQIAEHQFDSTIKLQDDDNNSHKPGNQHPNNQFIKSKHMDQLVMTSPQFDSMTDGQIYALPRLPLVVARCLPETEVKKIQAFEMRHSISTMTGDGVNYFRSYRIADVDIAMGKNVAM
ncbi:hypothetical protein BDB00DRAFT_789011 [Zychaea mexicana]|uniref:uncharacterized protein n=1 Tax=Zychaea mexicana TaxID=64656 RepID=UPI0022FF08E6|nr:uncharacterized protein BDB00DRAFT_789011 [Zychaea mexicana]KAI9492046.1 hypothetical protein BDB00DRAFT_789011 [Zychaea mexicana]